MTQPTCEIRRCKRDSSRLTLKGGLGTRVIAHICTFHWNLVSFLTAPRRFSALWTHRLKTVQVGNLVLFALHKGGTIYVTEHFATLTPEQMVYVLCMKCYTTSSIEMRGFLRLSHWTSSTSVR